MPIVPKTRAGKLDFYESHIDAWRADPASIGLDAASTDAQADRIAEARAAYDAHFEAINAARAATQRYYNAVEAMHAGTGAGADMIETIKAFAETTGDAGVYARASLPPPSPRGTLPPPGRPTRLRVGLRADGSLGIAWDCKNPRGAAGTVYEIMRSVETSGGVSGGGSGGGSGGASGGRSGESGGGTPLIYLATVGGKAFIDDTIPAGATRLVYQITALRSTRRGEPARFPVQFGGVQDGRAGRSGRTLGLAA